MFSSIKTGFTCLYSHSHIANGPSSPVSLFPAGSVFIVFLTHPVWFARSSPLAGAVFLVFPCPYPIGFSLFSLPSNAASSCFCGFLFVSLPVVACRWAVRCRVPPVPVSSPVSIFDVCGGETVSVSWSGDYPVAWCCGDGGVVLSFRLAARFLSVRGAGSFSWFFHMELLGGLFVRSNAEAKRFI